MTASVAETTADVLSRSPEEGARRLALSYLDQAVAALPRLHGDGDPEALHDLRVALRRLRSCLRSYAAHLGDSVPGKLARRLRRLARATGPGRDAEVQIAWLREHGQELARHHRAGRDWLMARLEARMSEAYGELRGELAQDFAPFEGKMRGRLAVYRAEVRLDGGRLPAFGDAAADLVHDHAQDLERRLGKVQGAADVEAAHQARISAKRLRYLADPLAQLVESAHRLEGAQGVEGSQASQDSAVAGPARRPRASEAPRPSHVVQRLKGLQDVLGELHDAHVMEAELAAALSEAAAERAARVLEVALADGEVDQLALRHERRRPQEAGLLALARLNRGRRDRLFADFAGRWQGERTAELIGAAEALAAALRAAAQPQETTAEVGSTKIQ